MYESQFEEDLYKLRRDKLDQIAELGQKAGLSPAAARYPNSYAISAPGWNETHGALVPWLKNKYDSFAAPVTGEQLEADRIEVSLAGRIMAIRVQGKAGFAQLQQSGVRMQIYVRKDDVGEDAFALYKLLDLGDHIGVRGYLFRTRTGELTIHVTALTFLAKAMLALPDKYHGLEDTELRYRQRYVDLFMNTGHSAKAAATPVGQPQPSESSFPNLGLSSRSEAEGSASQDEPQPSHPAEESPLNVREVFVKRAAILRALHTFFDSRGYLEVETPMMHTVAGGAAARPFNTHHNALDLDLKLRIAPELYLKRLVVGGMDRVYEINRNFRNEGISTQHNPEFTMLEFYQAYSNYQDLMKLTPELIAFVAKEVNGTTETTFNGIKIDLAPENWQQLSMREAIIKFWPEMLNANQPKYSDFESASAFRQMLATTTEGIRRQIDAEMASGFSFETKLKPGVFIAVDQEDEQRKFGEHRRWLMNFQAKQFGEAITESLRRMEDESYLGKAIADVFEWLGEDPIGKQLIQPTIIYDYPLAVSPLSKQKPDEPDWVERFEFYIGGFEVGNAFSELNDPDDQRARFEAQLLEKARGDEEAMAAMDEDYVRALGYGLPPTAGEGIGIDRLTMILTGSRSIRDVILFPLMRPHSKAAPEGSNEPAP